MEVTLYVEQEKKSLLTNPDEWLTKAQELGLEKQVALMNDSKNPNPFLRMDKSLRNIFDTLCPRKISITEYDVEPIPYEALGMYGLATHENHFGEVQIWYNESDPDPVMVGVVKHEKSWENEHFLMARWGLDKLSIAELKEKAKKLWIAQSIHKCKKQIAEYTAKLNEIEQLAELQMNGEYTGL